MKYPITRICKICKKSFQSFGDTVCQKDREYQNYICSHPQLEKKEITILPELRFFFNKTMITKLFEEDGFNLNGSFEQDKKDKGRYSIHIYLFQFVDIYNEDEMIKKICNTLSHEYIHKTVTIDCNDDDASKKMDNGLIKKLTEEGLLG